jgi:hypothetical protein
VLPWSVLADRKVFGKCKHVGMAAGCSGVRSWTWPTSVEVCDPNRCVRLMPVADSPTGRLRAKASPAPRSVGIRPTGHGGGASTNRSSHGWRGAKRPQACPVAGWHCCSATDVRNVGDAHRLLPGTAVQSPPVVVRNGRDERPRPRVVDLAGRCERCGRLAATATLDAGLEKAPASVTPRHLACRACGARRLRAVCLRVSPVRCFGIPRSATANDAATDIPRIAKRGPCALVRKRADHPLPYVRDVSQAGGDDCRGCATDGWRGTNRNLVYLAAAQGNARSDRPSLRCALDLPTCPRAQGPVPLRGWAAQAERLTIDASRCQQEGRDRPPPHDLLTKPPLPAAVFSCNEPHIRGKRPRPLPRRRGSLARQVRLP